MFTKRVRTQSIGTRKKRCPNGNRRDKKSGLCVRYEGLKVFKDLKDQEISKTKDTMTLESLDTGAIIKMYKDGELIEQKYVDEKMLEKAKAMGERDSKLLIKTMNRIKKNPDILNDKKFKRFKKKMEDASNKKRGIVGGGKEGSQNQPVDIDILIQEDTLQKLQSKKITNLHKKIQDIENQLKEEVDMYYETWSSFNGILAVISLASLTGGLFDFGGSITNYLQNPITSGFTTDIVIFITNLVAFMFSTEDINTIQSIVLYIIYSVSIGVTISLLPFITLNVYEDSIALSGLVLLVAKNIMISLRDKSPKELRLESELKDAKDELVKAMENQ